LARVTGIVAAAGTLLAALFSNVATSAVHLLLTRDNCGRLFRLGVLPLFESTFGRHFVGICLQFCFNILCNRAAVLLDDLYAAFIAIMHSILNKRSCSY
jgi:hypothetical protein